ncbi:MAG: S26 family signal peptidase [Actinobacteria bacterium]|nr:S26 family signal peptidase [Actinomycetota bacterium]
MVARGPSMQPTVEPGSFLLVTERGAIRPGVVVVIDRDGRDIVKRVEMDDGDFVTVVGDNTAASTDSRAFGPVPRSAIRGVARAVYWPPSAWRLL